MKALLILCLSIGLTYSAFAQEQTGSIRGVITDNEDNILPGVTIAVESEEFKQR